MSEVSRTFRSEVSGHFGPRSEVGSVLKHFGPGPKCPRSELSSYRFDRAAGCDRRPDAFATAM